MYKFVASFASHLETIFSLHKFQFPHTTPSSNIFNQSTHSQHTSFSMTTFPIAIVALIPNAFFHVVQVCYSSFNHQSDNYHYCESPCYLHQPTSFPLYLTNVKNCSPFKLKKNTPPLMLTNWRTNRK